MNDRQVTASIITVGSEILKGKIIDFNSSNISNYLIKLGINVKYHLSVSDNILDLIRAFKKIEKSDIVITTGGLGPTDDDNTKKAFAEYLNKKLFFDENLWKELKKYYFIKRENIPESNKKQAMNIKGSEIIENKNGTAPGLFYNYNGKYYFLLPGPPRENIPMLKKFVIKKLKSKKYTGNPLYEKIIKIYGLGESNLADILKNINKNCEIGYYFKREGFIELHISKQGKNYTQLKEMVDRTLEEIKNKLDKKKIFYTDNYNLNKLLFLKLKESSRTVSIADTICGGKISSKIVEIPGSSKVFTGSIVAYSNNSKIEILDISQEIIKEHGAVSEKVSREMAANVRNVFDSDIGAGITGIAGPNGGTEEKPVGLVYFTINIDDKNYSFKREFIGDRKRIINKTINSLFIELIKLLDKK